jgi:cyclic pyranopterin phosphate synthase
MKPETATAIQERSGPKGDVLQVARIAALNGTKRTDELIPLCHNVPLDKVEVQFKWLSDCELEIQVMVAATSKTGVEMEALTGASMAALTVYDMCKAIDRSMQIASTQLLSKSGGVRGDYNNERETNVET